MLTAHATPQFFLILPLFYKNDRVNCMVFLFGVTLLLIGGAAFRRFR